MKLVYKLHQRTPLWKVDPQLTRPDYFANCCKAPYSNLHHSLSVIR